MEKSLLKHRQCEERFNFDKEKRLKYGTICGIDEAGRGPWIGDVYAAAVIFDGNVFIEGLNDSKKLSEAKREELYEEIIQKARAYSVAYATTQEIEELNILQATFLAMKRAYEGLEITPNFALIDGNRIPTLPCTVETVVKGDSQSASIAAASILAKVSRDRKMRELDKLYPEFNFASNKGYGTAEHIAALKEYGVTPVHRLSFLKKQEQKQGFPFKEYICKETK